MKSTEIQTELEQVEGRLVELGEMRGKLENAVSRLQSDFINKKISLDNVQTEQSKLDTLNNSIRTLESTRNNLQNELQKVVAGETREALLSQAKSAALESETALNSYLKIREKFNETTAKLTEQMMDSVLLFRTKQKEYQRTVRQIETNDPGTPINLNLPESTRKTIVNDAIPYPKLEYAECIDLAGRILSNRREKEEQKGRSARG